MRPTLITSSTYSLISHVSPCPQIPTLLASLIGLEAALALHITTVEKPAIHEGECSPKKV